MNQSNASHVATDYLWGKLRQLICKVVKENTEKKKKVCRRHLLFQTEA